jgi:GTPase
MKFLDEAKIFIKAGHGGRGRVSYAPFRTGPDGGDGGKGGSIIFRASSSKNTLIDFKFQTKYVAKSGEPGGTNNMTGADAEDLIISVPAGTLIKDAETGKIIADLDASDKDVVILEGGRGGKGNLFYVTPSRQAPDYAQPGGQADEKWVLIELKLLADVGLVGLPNAGKSTLISRISAARPKIADYPFTTLVPNLGVVKYHDTDFVVADVPGLIKDAHKGSGLGIKFLKHIERTKVLVHLVDVSHLSQDPVEDIQVINHELKMFSKDIAARPMIYVLNKMDAADTEHVQRVQDYLIGLKHDFVEISAVSGKGLDLLLQKLSTVLKKVRHE